MALAAPTNLRMFQRLFPNEEACRNYLALIRWPEGFICPVCKSRKGWRLRERPIVTMCENNHQTSLTAGTVMHRTRQPLSTWLYAAYLVSTLTPGISAVQFQKHLGLKRYETAWNMLHKLRAALGAPRKDRLTGTVEVNEAHLGSERIGTKRHGVGKELIIGAVEIHFDGAKVRAGALRLGHIPDREEKTLTSWVEANVATADTTVHTSPGYGYKRLGKYGYNHVPILQSVENDKGVRRVPMICLVMGNLRQWLTGTHKGAVSPKHLQAYLNEFAFRFHWRSGSGPAFLRALGLIVDTRERPEYETLYSGEWEHPSP